MTIERLYFDLSISEPQSNLTHSNIDDLIRYIFDNRTVGSELCTCMTDSVPWFEYVMVIDVFHPKAPDSLEIHLFRDESGCWWPYLCVDVLPMVSTFTKYGVSQLDVKG